MSDPRLKQIKIKTGVLKRVGKEKLSYKKEADQNKARLEKMREEGKDEHDLKLMREVLKETMMMIPDCQRRLLVAHGDMTSVLETEKDLSESEEYIAAREQMKEADEQLKIE